MSTKNDFGLPVPGTTIAFKNHSWKVIRQIYEGPFSNVFMLEDAKDNRKTYAMKVEKQIGCQRPVLKLDVCVLSLMKGEPGFPALVSAGRTEHYKFCVMKYVGPELATLQWLMPGNQFSPSTTYRIALQTLDRIQALHAKGYLNRDLKATNFAVGLGHESNIVYMLDFGLTRRFRNAEGRQRVSRGWGPCVGTVPYAPLAAGFLMDQAPKDDLEGWFYMMIHLIRGHLPWYGERPETYDHGATREFKVQLRHSYRRPFFNQLPKEWETIFDAIINTGFDRSPPYRLIRNQLNNIITRERINMNLPLDWQVVPRLMEQMKIASLGRTVSRECVTEEKGGKTDRVKTEMFCDEWLEKPELSNSPVPESNYAWDTEDIEGLVTAVQQESTMIGV